MANFLLLISSARSFAVNEGLIRRGGDGEPPGDGQVQAVLRLPQVGALAPHPIGHVLGDPGIRQDQSRGIDLLFLLELHLDFLVNAFQDRIEHGVAVAGQDIQAFHHAEGVKHRAGGVAPDVGHAEELVALELFFHIGDEVEELRIRGQKLFKEPVLEAEDRADILRRRLQAEDRSKQLFEVVEDSHVCRPIPGVSRAILEPSGEDFSCRRLFSQSNFVPECILSNSIPFGRRGVEL